MPFVSKYKPSAEFICALTRRQLYGEGVKSINNIARFHKYPHTIPYTDEIPVKIESTFRESIPVVMNVDNRASFEKLRVDSRDKLLDIDRQLLMRLIEEHLRGPTISKSVQKKAHAYIIQVMEQDKWFRDNFLGGVPRTDAEVFAKRFLLHALDLLKLRQSPDGKLFRLPVHKCITQTCEAIAANHYS